MRGLGHRGLAGLLRNLVRLDADEVLALSAFEFNRLTRVLFYSNFVFGLALIANYKHKFHQ